MRSPSGFKYDAAVIGAGPNGLAAAIELARNGRSVIVREAADTVGGSCRSAALTLPAYVHDVCSTVQALALASPMLASLPLSAYGFEAVHPLAPVAHPFDDGSAVLIERSVEATARQLGSDGQAYRDVFQPLVDTWGTLAPELLGPLRFSMHPLLLARFGLNGIRSARSFARHHFTEERARGVFAGLAAHSVMPMEATGTAAFGMVLAVSAHAGGWPVARGGSQRLADAMAAYLRSVGGVIKTGREVRSLDELADARSILCDVTPRQFLRLAGDRLPTRDATRLKRFRYSPGAFKMDWALSAPVPWKAPEVGRAGTVHLGGTFDEIAESERACWEGRRCERPYVLVVQATQFDRTRAPAGRHTLWAYCHVPHGSTEDASAAVEGQIERFAPGFRDVILQRSAMGPAALERHNPNLVGGDVTGGANMLSQLFSRPTSMLSPYKTPLPRVYFCSASTPPGGGVHGMCGYHAARAAIRGE